MKIENLSKDEALRSSQWDYYIEDFKGGSELELRQFVESKLQLDDYSFKNLLYRWLTYHNLEILNSETQHNYFVDNKSLECLTVEQFKERFNDDNFDVFVADNLLTFKCGPVKGLFHNNEQPKKPMLSSFLDSQSGAISWICHNEGVFPHFVKAVFEDTPNTANNGIDKVDINYLRFYIDSSPKKEEEEISEVLEGLNLFQFKLNQVDAGWGTKEWCAIVDFSKYNSTFYNWHEIGESLLHTLGDNSKVSILLDRQNVYWKNGDKYDSWYGINLTVRKVPQTNYDFSGDSPDLDKRHW